jgi:hypothetical protein
MSNDYREAFLTRQAQGQTKPKKPTTPQTEKHSYDAQTDIDPRDFELFGSYGAGKTGS